MSNPKYTLAYFNLRGGGEPIRFIFEYLGIPYEDKRYDWSSDEWKADKPKYPWGVLPALEDKEKGFMLGQSSAITAYLGRKHNLEGANEQEAARCLEYTMAIVDLYVASYPLHVEEDEEKRKELVQKFIDETIPKNFPKMEADIKANGGKWIVGKGVTYADFVVSNGFEQLKVILGNPNILDKYPALIAYCEGIFAIPQIKAWIARRPDTKF